MVLVVFYEYRKSFTRIWIYNLCTDFVRKLSNPDLYQNKYEESLSDESWQQTRYFQIINKSLCRMLHKLNFLENQLD